ncbi:lytic transglycosylase domain-containing protein [Kitasatospora sp. McL0602]|uniref:lytic transglycosylase domain-containing protein n=1 Tax=Kitasatospora sp. McL0602 TaxID=3439530 RepID=UPI003F8C7B45
MSSDSGTKRRRRRWAAGLTVLVLLAGIATVVLVERGRQKVTVPAALVPLIDAAARTCSAVTPSLIAGQLYAESHFNARAVSAAGAQGIAQFTPETWAEWGVDGNRDGTKDVFDPADAVPAQAKYDCWLAQQTASVPGNATDNMLAAYNAGPGAVTKYKGVPPYPETQGYVTKVDKYAALFRYLDPTPTARTTA